MAVRAPEPTPEGYHWLCNSCQWEGRTLADAKEHLLETELDTTPWSHAPFEAQVGATGAMHQIARRIMLPSGKPDTVMVSSYRAAQRRFAATTKPLIESLRARGGRLKAARG